jgi:hypothetical protein
MLPNRLPLLPYLPLLVAPGSAEPVVEFVGLGLHFYF